MTLRQIPLALIEQLEQLPAALEARCSTIEQRRVGVTCIIRFSPTRHRTRLLSKPNLRMTLLRALILHSYSTTTMHPRPSLLRAAQLASRQTRTSPFRSTIQRRFDSHSTQTKLSGPMDNAFNRGRLAGKEHAKGSTGNLWSIMQSFK